jgi:hypothetical protein
LVEVSGSLYVCKIIFCFKLNWVILVKFFSRRMFIFKY